VGIVIHETGLIKRIFVASNVGTRRPPTLTPRRIFVAQRAPRLSSNSLWCPPFGVRRKPRRFSPGYLTTGSLFILTGQAGAGKSHLAASSRRNGTVWILDTEGASKNLLGKPGVHKMIQAVQTLSLAQLTAAMQEIKRLGKPGDTVVLNSVSKVLQAMRAYAQQHAGGETDRKASIEVDEYASFNRNLQTIYTGMTELKHAGFHVIIIGHLAKQYQDHGEERSRDDVGGARR